MSNDTKTYFQQFCEDYKVTEENNSIEINIDNGEQAWKSDAKIFSEDKEGNLKILAFSLTKQVFYIPRTDPLKDKHYKNDYELFYITRFAEPKKVTDKKTSKVKLVRYQIPKEAGTHPFFPPYLVDLWEKKEKINTLVLTEGYKKAWYASMFNAAVVGLSSITHVKDTETKSMYEDVLTIIRDCQVENIIMLYDGDCVQLKDENIADGDDLYRRPSTFVASIDKVRELLKDYDNLDIYFAHVNSDAFNDKPKGLDDILFSGNDAENQILEDLFTFSKATTYFVKFKINTNLNKVIQHLGLGRVENFYNKHQEKLMNNEFLYKGTSYQWDETANELKILIPASAKEYIRVGDDFFKFVKIPNKYGETEHELHKRKRTTIKDYIGERNVQFIPKYEAFCNVPQNKDYQPVIHNCYNLYSPFEHESEEGDCSITLDFVKHIFQEHNELGLDYIQLLYFKPAQKLPILCLISKENNTGKSSFAQYLQLLFQQNAIIIGNEDLHSDFNSHWISKLVIGIDEGLIEKTSVIEKLKKLSTDEKVIMNSKGRDQRSIDFFGKFIINSNNETTFIKASQHDTRYWIRKVPVIRKLDPEIMKKLYDEIPAFLHFIENRKLSTEKISRMWFHHDLLKTDAFNKLVDNNKPQLEKSIREKVKELFLDSGLKELQLPLNYLREYILGSKNTDKDSYLRFVLEELLELDRYKNKTGKYDLVLVKLPKYNYQGILEFEELRCRPYIFPRSKFVSELDLLAYEMAGNESEETPKRICNAKDLIMEKGEELF